ncbi:MAG: GNAT family N-acetyltransferase [Proteobacteria bacterium]|nr:GNAT family N-acetyltransferase [Pseudomonadota bacterium]HQR03239.1 GNAT family N-acetyltransferase [Rhodocyclaceae bacterium]
MTPHIALLDSLAEAGPALQTLAAQGNPFLDPAFLAALEHHGAVSEDMGWQPRHIALFDGAILAGLMPLYARSHSFGDFSRDFGWAQAWREAGLRYYPKWVSAIPYTPANGPRFLLAPGCDRTATMQALLTAAVQAAESAGVELWQCLFIDDEALSCFHADGFLIRHNVQYHWRNAGYGSFDDFLATLTAKRRKEIRRERLLAASSGFTIQALHGDEITHDQWAAIHRHYRDTFQRHGTPAAFGPGFFPDVGHKLGRRMVVFAAMDGDRPVASAICYRGDNALYGRHWGTDIDHSGLHFELCFYQGIEYCLTEGLALFEPGAGGEHKIARGFMPVATRSAYWVRNPRMRRMVADFIAREDRLIDAYIESGVSNPFRNPHAGS